MKVANLILHILTNLALFVLEVVPLCIALVGGAISLAFINDTHLDQDVAKSEAVLLLFCVFACLFAVMLLIMGIVAFVQRKKMKSYIIFESLSNVFAFLGVLFTYLSAWRVDELLEADFESLRGGAVFPLILTIITTILMVISAITDKPNTQVNAR